VTQQKLLFHGKKFGFGKTRRVVSCKAGDVTAGFREGGDWLSSKTKLALSDMLTCQANSFIGPLWARVPRVVIMAQNKLFHFLEIGLASLVDLYGKIDMQLGVFYSLRTVQTPCYKHS
jgi:hypothetical protein